MKPIAPFYLIGENGRTLDERPRRLDELGVINAVLKTRSLDFDELTFHIKDNDARPAIPDDEQWVTLIDDTGRILFTGIAKRSFQYPQRIYGFRCSNVYKALSETPFIQDARGYVLYGEGDAMLRIRDILVRAKAAGLPINPPEIEDLPPGYLVPKQAFRSATFSTALEEASKWVPDLSTRMDYSTSPPTLRFYCRISETAKEINLYAADNKTSEVELESWTEARALAISFAYARRDGDDVVQYLIQSAGNDTAEARRKVSLFLSGQERTDLLITEALTTAQRAVAVATAAVDAVGATIDATAASAQIQFTWTSMKPRDSNLQAASTAQPSFSMWASYGESYTLYSSITWGSGTPATGTDTMPTKSMALRTSPTSSTLATGWYPIESGSFSDAELTLAGATKETRYITGDMVAVRYYSGSNVGMNVLETSGGLGFSGWTSGSAASETDAQTKYRKYVKYPISLTVDAINMAPTSVAAAVKAAAGSGSSALISRAEFVEAPADLAANYFKRQDWTPYKGSINYTPSGRDIPQPGDFVSIIGEATPDEWKSMKVPIYELTLDLSTQIARLGVGPSPRMDFTNLLDRLRIPPEDNTEAG